MLVRVAAAPRQAGSFIGGWKVRDWLRGSTPHRALTRYLPLPDAARVARAVVDGGDESVRHRHARVARDSDRCAARARTEATSRDRALARQRHGRVPPRVDGVPAHAVFVTRRASARTESAEARR